MDGSVPEGEGSGIENVSRSVAAITYPIPISGVDFKSVFNK
jgi:hypothetical protein